MSRSFYDNPRQKKIVDDIAKHRSDIAIQNSLRSADLKAKANRETALQIQQPPAQFKSAAEEAQNAGYQNTLAIKNLDSFMYPEDTRNSYGYLLKHNSINEFNQYFSYFKQSIGNRHLSFLEFESLWIKFIEQIYNNKFIFTKPLLTYDTKRESKVNTGPRLNLPASEGVFPYSEALINKMSRVDIIKLIQNNKDDFNIPSILGPHGGLKGNDKIKLPEIRKYINDHLNTNSKLGSGFKKHRIKGGGLNNQSLLHRYNILSGEVLAGNDNKNIIEELYSLINLLKSKKLLKIIN